ncbi:phage integrase family protein [Pseudomonas chlororaphis subsp. aurantiaca]|uniref:hypothetical protein n=1 Tax=Pseudomonas chlororaphis TaxID=587753 RepID=UPI00086569BC|nr:hypothetical protein [Pseudomonas chlororaphis]BAV72856.1 phage integrase family protein [Pseudomonas chlororaphis subsp. aurantiaca]
MCAQTARLSDRQLKAVKPKDKDYVLTDMEMVFMKVERQKTHSEERVLPYSSQG